MTSSLRGAAALALLFSLLFGGPAQALDAAGAHRAIDDVVKAALGAFAGRHLSPADQASRVADLIAHHGDGRLYAEDLLGRYWARATPEDRDAFRQVFESYLPDCWSSLIGDVPASLKIEFGADERLPDGRMMVHSLASVPGDTLAVDWTVAPAPDGRPIIADVSVEGVSVLQTMRADFQAFLRANGGRIGALGEALKGKIGRTGG
jgi:phospholipid transport system substrate-binding protein